MDFDALRWVSFHRLSIVGFLTNETKRVEVSENLSKYIENRDFKDSSMGGVTRGYLGRKPGFIR